MSDYATIPVQKKTRERLKAIGTKAETYDMLVRKLLSIAEHSQIMETHYRRIEEKDQFVPLEEL